MEVIRLAQAQDIGDINRLLEEVLRIHHEGRPDLFKAIGKKYSDERLIEIFENPDTPVFVFDEDGKVLGYAFCALRQSEGDNLVNIKTLYIDDICIDPLSRGKRIGSRLFERVKQFASEQGCYNITLHVWECNPGAKAFYEHLGMSSQYTSMELVIK